MGSKKQRRDCQCFTIRCKWQTKYPSERHHGTSISSFGFDSLKLIKELHSLMSDPLTDRDENPRAMDEELFLLMTYWATEAENNINFLSDLG